MVDLGSESANAGVGGVLGTPTTFPSTGGETQRRGADLPRTHLLLAGTAAA